MLLKPLLCPVPPPLKGVLSLQLTSLIGEACWLQVEMLQQVVHWAFLEHLMIVDEGTMHQRQYGQ
jgi:hypothetical protein